jgi:hypothetical protein
LQHTSHTEKLAGTTKTASFFYYRQSPGTQTIFAVVSFPPPCHYLLKFSACKHIVGPNCKK